MSVTINAGILAEYLDYIDPIAAEFKLNTSEEGVTTRVVDPSNVAMASVSLSSEHYSGAFGEGVLGLGLERLDDVVGLADGDITLEFNDETRKLDAASDGLSFTIGLIDPSAIRQEPDLPDLDEQWVADVTITAGALTRACKATDMVSDHLRLSANPDGREFVVSASGDVDDMRWAFDDESDGLSEAAVSEECGSLFSLDFIQPIAKAFDRSADVRLRLGNDVPISMTADTEWGTAEYLVAPRITNNGGGR